MTHTPFIETQFPLSYLSAESYKERKANLGQTLTGLGKWWGRKPLVLVRAVIFGLLMPASNNPEKDREVFFRVMTMDEDGLWRRKNKPLKASDIAALVKGLESEGLIEKSGGKVRWAKGIDKADREKLERLAFNRLGYDEKLTLCLRPEQVDGPSEESWAVINDHLGTSASSLNALAAELSDRLYGRRVRVGDVFCGGGSIPFEAARLGCEAWGSDLNPVAALLTWAAVHLAGGGEEVRGRVEEAQRKAWEKADAQITAWGIEHDGAGNRADAYLYCVEAVSPATGLRVPLAPSWVISEKYNVVAELERNDRAGGYDIHIITGASDEQMRKAKEGTVQNSELVCPETKNRYGIAGLRGPGGLRLWDNEDLVPRPGDVFTERLYCVRWVTPGGMRLYRSAAAEDLEREEKVLSLLKERFADWQEKGYIPSKKIEPGYNTSQPIRERGWTRWHHLFHPRQLLEHGLYQSKAIEEENPYSKVALFLKNGVMCNFSSRICTWNKVWDKTEQTFLNNALNTQLNYGIRTILTNKSVFLETEKCYSIFNKDIDIKPADARSVTWKADFWITDPPYADAVNYHELADFFLAWYEKHLPKFFPDWYADGRSALAVKGADEDFKRGMVDIYENLTRHMDDRGFQVVMFTHQDPSVWADLGMILWAAGLKVTAAWTIGTETTSGLKVGNYVQGTVFLVLRKRLDEETVFLDELYPLVDDEVRAQMDRMHAVDDDMRPQFGDTDYQLGAYAAALKVLTAYADIEGQDIRHELFRARKKNESSPFEKIIHRAVSIAAGHLVPRGLSSHLWRNLSGMERLYLRGLELERHGEMRHGAYQELARGFGVQDYKVLLGSPGANQARFKTPSEFKRSSLSEGEWGGTLLRHLLFALYEIGETEKPREGLNYLKNARADYWSRREDIQALLGYLEEQGKYHRNLAHWQADSESAELLKGLVANDY